MTKNKADFFVKTILAFSITSIITNFSVATENPFSVESAFKHDNKENIQLLFQNPYTLDEQDLSQENNIIIINSSDNSHLHDIEIVSSDEGIEITNVEEDNQILFVQNKYDDLNWQRAIQSTQPDFEHIAEFLNQGFSIDKPVFEDGNNMLILGAMQNRSSLVNFAVNNGANLSHTNKEGQNVFYWAAANQDTEILNNLLEKNKSSNLINKVDKLGRTPLHVASAKNNIEAVKLLLKNNADMNIKDKDGRTPLFYALTSKSYQVASFLLEKNRDISLADKQGSTIESLILASGINMYELSFNFLPENIQNQIIVSLKDAPQVVYKLKNYDSSISFDKFNDMQKYGTEINEDIIS